MQKKKKEPGKVRKQVAVPMLGLLVALAFCLSYLEAQVAFLIPVPGVKLGLTNLAVLTALYKMGEKEAAIINLVRIFLAAFTFGSLFSLAYSLAGGVFSILVMIGLKRSGRCSILAVSVAGGVCHNIGQIVVAMLVLHTTKIVYYLVILWISGIVAGALVGFLGDALVKRLPDMALEERKTKTEMKK